MWHKIAARNCTVQAPSPKPRAFVAKLKCQLSYSTVQYMESLRGAARGALAWCNAPIRIRNFNSRKLLVTSAV